MLDVFNLPPDTNYRPPLANRRYIDQTTQYLDAIRRRTRREPVHPIRSQHPLAQLIKRIAPTTYEDYEDHQRLMSIMLADTVSTTGFVGELVMGRPIDMQLTSPRTKDIIYLHDTYDEESDTPLVCLHHTFTHVDLRMPGNNWGDTEFSQYSLWSLNGYTMMRLWHEYMTGLTEDQYPNVSLFINHYVLMPAIVSIADIALLNRVYRDNEGLEYDDPDNYKYAFNVRSMLSDVDMMAAIQPYALKTLLRSVTALNPEGMLSSLHLPSDVVSRHLMYYFAVARAHTLQAILALYRNQPPSIVTGAYKDFATTFRRMSFTSNNSLLTKSQALSVRALVHNFQSL